MGKRIVIALNYVVDANHCTFVAGNCKSDGIRPVACRKSGAGAARIAKVAECVAGTAAEGSSLGLGRAGHRMAEALPPVSQKSMVEQNPTDSFARYGLAMEYRNTGDLEAAMGEFRALMAVNPDYAPAYFHGGQTLERMGRSEEAREVYLQGIEVTARKGDQHGRSEMQAALDMLD